MMDGAKAASFETLRMAWRQRNVQTFESAMKFLAEQLTAAILDAADVRDETLMERVGIRRGEINQGVYRSAAETGDQMAERAEHDDQ